MFAGVEPTGRTFVGHEIGRESPSRDLGAHSSSGAAIANVGALDFEQTGRDHARKHDQPGEPSRAPCPAVPHGLHGGSTGVDVRGGGQFRQLPTTVLSSGPATPELYEFVIRVSIDKWRAARRAWKKGKSNKKIQRENEFRSI